MPAPLIFEYLYRWKIKGSSVKLEPWLFLVETG